MGMLKEFKEFAMKGNMVDMAVGVMIGAAFGDVVKSLVNDIFTPIIGVIANTSSLSNYSTDVISPIDNKTVLVSVAWGKFLDTIIKFTLVAFCLFLVIKVMNAAKRKQAVEPPTPETMTKDQLLLTEIRDLMKQK
jgi:large conductance mechanosensitive channel